MTKIDYLDLRIIDLKARLQKCEELKEIPWRIETAAQLTIESYLLGAQIDALYAEWKRIAG